jgi:hypothetical protein
MHMVSLVLTIPNILREALCLQRVARASTGSILAQSCLAVAAAGQYEARCFINELLSTTAEG